MKEQLKEAIMQTIVSWDESEITEAFVEMLIDIVRELYESGFIQETFGSEIPVLIHEL